MSRPNSIASPPGLSWQRRPQNGHKKTGSISSPFLDGSLTPKDPPLPQRNAPAPATPTPAPTSSALQPRGGVTTGRDSPFGSTISSTTGRDSPFGKLLKSEKDKRIQSGTLESKQVDSLVGIADGNDFSGRRWVWIKDADKAFLKAEVLNDTDGMLQLRCEDGSLREVHVDQTDKVNPAKFDKANDMAKLTHLNEASVVHNLHLRYQSDLIYTYSGLFLVAVNPYCNLPIYTNEYVNVYRNRSREEPEPHIFATTDLAFRNMLEMKENQSILVTGESGAGKTENTKKVIQYLANVAPGSTVGTTGTGTLEQQILQANPILEAFGNAQTVRNNNSSRFGKFIRIEFSRSGQIVGAYIDWYLLEKSRVVKQSSEERNYHVFYQLLRGASRALRDEFLLGSETGLKKWSYTAESNEHIAGIDDGDEFETLLDAFKIMGFENHEQIDVLRIIAAVLHIGNLEILPERRGGDEAKLADRSQAEMLCHVLGIPIDKFVQGLLKPKVKAGREWVTQNRNKDQVKHSLDALAKSLYERGFGKLVEMINEKFDHRSSGSDSESFIGVLDIAGFEIFENNSFEQLCINYTNEKLQQFFNHHMFVLEQEEYAREKIEWKFIDFGRDLQPTIDLIELSNPIGIFSCLDEDCVMPKATDASFTDKLNSLWDKKTPKYKKSLLTQGFVLTHYAAEVEYVTEGWLEKNKDPLNDNITKLLAASRHAHIASLFADCAEEAEGQSTVKSRVKKGLFRTVAQRHKEQLSSLMSQLNSTHPHFVRCIIPNHQKRPKRLHAPLVLDQLRCNGVLEGIRIARTGFPNRLPFAEFRNRYEVLTPKMPKGYIEGQKACQLMLEQLDLDPSYYRVGLTKVFFRAGVLAELEEQRDKLMKETFIKFQSYCRGYLRRRVVHKRLYRTEATRIIQKNMRIYLELQQNPWWGLFVKMKPLLGAANISSAEVKKKEEIIKTLEAKMIQEASEKHKLEEERRKADTELTKVIQTLESERALALDKEEIFKRMQQREADLAEKLAGALEDQDDLEEQLDELMDAKKKADEQAEAWRAELEQGGILIKKLEAEKLELANKLEEVEARLKQVEEQKTARRDATDKLEQEIQLLKSHLDLKDRKLTDLEKKLLASDEKLDEKLAVLSKDYKQAQKQVRELVEENRTIRQQLSELSTTSNDYEELVRRKESELSVLRADLQKAEVTRKVWDEERIKLVTDHDEVQMRLTSCQREMDTLRRQKDQLEREVSEARRLLEAKISEDQRSGQGRKILDEQIKDKDKKQGRE
ncbi:hypothetical protein BJ508DRAFT_103304 [Ascobolus immersus RN42]|uniref:Myosin motor domain-containing protein n=1 Tax=Ascobolus immersus RN42 TaxID=1160509 RepID=A0A3N4I7G6_ASCIM|nr:hypothetical protein BJ508DRAFT_103304 [Ascobolus immersus RN42]